MECPVKKRVIFTACSARYVRLFLRMFYPTLRRTGRYEEDVRVVLFGDIEAGIRTALLRQGLAIEAEWSANRLNQDWKFEFARLLHREYEEVYFYDCDIYFQSDVRPLFRHARPGRLSVCTEPTIFDRYAMQRRVGFNERNALRMSAHLPWPEQERLHAWLTGRAVLNGGFFGGRQLGDLYGALLRFGAGWPRIGFGFDQTILNFWAYYFPETIHRVPKRFALALCRTPDGLHVGPRGLLMLGRQPAVAVHVNRHRSPREKLRDPDFARFLEHHPQCRTRRFAQAIAALTPPVFAAEV